MDIEEKKKMIEAARNNSVRKARMDEIFGARQDMAEDMAVNTRDNVQADENTTGMAGHATVQGNVLPKKSYEDMPEEELKARMEAAEEAYRYTKTMDIKGRYWKIKYDRLDKESSEAMDSEECQKYKKMFEDAATSDEVEKICEGLPDDNMKVLYAFGMAWEKSGHEKNEFEKAYHAVLGKVCKTLIRTVQEYEPRNSKEVRVLNDGEDCVDLRVCKFEEWNTEIKFGKLPFTFYHMDFLEGEYYEIVYETWLKFEVPFGKVKKLLYEWIKQNPRCILSFEGCKYNMFHLMCTAGYPLSCLKWDPERDAYEEEMHSCGKIRETDVRSEFEKRQRYRAIGNAMSNKKKFGIF